MAYFLEDHVFEKGRHKQDSSSASLPPVFLTFLNCDKWVQSEPVTEFSQGCMFGILRYIFSSFYSSLRWTNFLEVRGGKGK